MIIVANKRILDFIDFLNRNYPLEEEIKVTCLHGYDAVMDDETDGHGFAVYLPEQKYILLPMEIPENVKEEALKDPELERDFVIHNLAHEYCHAIQDKNGDFEKYGVEKLDDYADKFADGAVAKFNLEYNSIKDEKGEIKND